MNFIDEYNLTTVINIASYKNIVLLMASIKYIFKSKHKNQYHNNIYNLINN